MCDTVLGCIVHFYAHLLKKVFKNRKTQIFKKVYFKMLYKIISKEKNNVSM
jgi:hypothetical protein